MLVAALVAGPRDRVPNVDEITAFERGLAPLAREGGQLVQMGLKVGIADLATEHMLAASVVEEQARTWEADFVRLHGRFQDLPATGALNESRRDFVAAIERYRRTAAAIRRAAATPDLAERDRLLDEAIALGREADRLFDAGSHRLQRFRLQRGMPQNQELPLLPEKT